MPRRVYDSMLDLIGDTPLVRLNRFDAPFGSEGEGRTDGAPAGDAPTTPRATLWGKCEQLEPAGSVKDRIALAMIERAEASGALRPGGTVIEPTSGNTGIALAMVCAVKRYRCVLTMPSSMSLERRQLLQAFGAEVVLTPAEAQMRGAIDEAQALAAKTPGSYVPHQFDNPANPEVHAITTAREIIEALRTKGIRKIDAFVAVVGTGGTVTGVGRALREATEFTCRRVIAVEPERCATLSRGERGATRIQGLAPGFEPAVFDRSVVDEIRTVDDDDAWRTMRALAERDGLMVGISAGAAAFAAAQVAREVGRETGGQGHVVTVLCDTGERYFSLSEHFKHLMEA
jgi:cysteine synthase A